MKNWIIENWAMSLFLLGGIIDILIRNIPSEKRTSIIILLNRTIELLDVLLDKLLGQKIKKS
jgi:hypothetical protein